MFPQIRARIALACRSRAGCVVVVRCVAVATDGWIASRSLPVPAIDASNDRLASASILALTSVPQRGAAQILCEIVTLHPQRLPDDCPRSIYIYKEELGHPVQDSKAATVDDMRSLGLPLLVLALRLEPFRSYVKSTPSSQRLGHGCARYACQPRRLWWNFVPSSTVRADLFRPFSRAIV